MLIGSKSLDGILKGFQKTIADLEKLQSVNDARIVSNMQTIEKLKSDNAVLDAESTKAAAVAAKLRGLIEA